MVLYASVWGQVVSPEFLEGLTMRNVGPAGMSGRITAIDVVEDDPKHIYVGSASGGVWESEDGGTTWTPIFDDQPSLAIGAIKINQQNPDEIWVGTGEGNPRNSQNSGKGIFRSIDGGKSWKLMGLESSRVIHRILIDFHNPSIVYAGVQGSPWGPGSERGVFKSTDSGKTWNKILYVNEHTGIGDLVMDPSNPKKLVAAMWEYGRTPWNFYSGGKGSGLHLSYDGGETWKKITDKEGLPKGDLGRIGLAIAPSSTNIIYALIEAKENGLYKSEDGGENWSLVTTKNIGNRPFYYNELYVDPQNENRLWNLYSYVSKSEDGGRTFETILDYGKGVHPDHHAFWIHPQDPDYIIDGNDGGLNISRDRGRNWYFAGNIPVGQFYHINIDMEYPYNLYGGMQDNGSWIGPAFVLKSGGIRNSDWRELYFGDGFDVVPRLSDSRYGWAMSQGGSLAYYDRETGFNQFVKPVHPDGVMLRFNWNAAIAAVPGSSCGIYYGSQFLHRSDDCGQSWSILSPDLTTNDTLKQKQALSGGLTIDNTTAENHTTILSIAPSPVDQNVIWVGTDDGNVQLTRDGGKTWSNLIGNMNGAPVNGWVPQIEVSAKNAGEAFVVINHYRREDWKPYVFYTTDYGVSWKNITRNKGIESYAMSIVQDPEVPELLFLGAEDGLYVTIDKGENWTRFPAKTFPHVPTSDLKIHPTDQSLAIGTFGRSLWVLDDIIPLREMARKKTSPGKFDIFPSPDVVHASFRSVDGTRFTADAEFKGRNRGGGARFPVYIQPVKVDSTAIPGKEEGRKRKTTAKAEAMVIDSSSADSSAVATTKKKEKDLMEVYVLDAGGDTIRYKKQKLREGWNTFYWDLRAKGIYFPSRREADKDDDDPAGVMVQPGTYKVVGLYQGMKDSVQVKVLMDPRLKMTAEDLASRNAMITEYYSVVTSAQKAFQALRDIRKDIAMTESLLSNAPDSVQTSIRDQHKNLNKKLEKLEEMVMEPENVKGLSVSSNINQMLGSAQNYLNTSPGKPGQNAEAQIRLAAAAVEKFVTEVNQFVSQDWAAFRTMVTGYTWPVFKQIELAD